MVIKAGPLNWCPVFCPQCRELLHFQASDVRAEYLARTSDEPAIRLVIDCPAGHTVDIAVLEPAHNDAGAGTPK